MSGRRRARNGARRLRLRSSTRSATCSNCSKPRQIPDEFALKPGLLLRLIKEPRWLLGLLSDFGGYIFHAAALGLAAVVFVEPILAIGHSDVVVHRRRPSYTAR